MSAPIRPSGPSGSSSPVDTVQKFLDQHAVVQVIIVQWVDICGVLRSRLLQVSRFKQLVATGGHLNSAPLDPLLTTTDDIVPSIFNVFTEKGKITLDLPTLTIAAHDGSGIGNAAVVTGNVEYRGADARINLKKVIEKAEKKHGMTFLVGIELEFCFLKPNSLEVAGPGTFGAGNSSFTHRGSIWPILNEIAVALSEAGIDVEQIVKEYGPSTWEIALPPLSPLAAVDAYVYCKEVIKNVAHKHGIVATFYPVPNEPGSAHGQKIGQHIHISATPVDASADWDPNTAMAGILSHMPALMAIGLSQIDSYERVGAAGMCTGGYVGWGDNHRDMPVRRVAKNHWEIRSHDATSNPYAMVAGIITAALDTKPLTIGGAEKWTLEITEEEREQLGITKLLPTSLEAALEELSSDKAWAVEALGEEYWDWFFILKKFEIEKLSKIEAKERRLKLINYF